MFNFAINMAEMTDEDIFAKMEQANSKIMKAYNAGASSQVIQQMQAIVQSYQFELYDRSLRQSFEMNRKQLEAPIESDPSLAEPLETPKEDHKPRKRVQF